MHWLFLDSLAFFGIINPEKWHLLSFLADCGKNWTCKNAPSLAMLLGILQAGWNIHSGAMLKKETPLIVAMVPSFLCMRSTNVKRHCRSCWRPADNVILPSKKAKRKGCGETWVNAEETYYNKTPESPPRCWPRDPPYGKEGPWKNLNDVKALPIAWTTTD